MATNNNDDGKFAGHNAKDEVCPVGPTSDRVCMKFKLIHEGDIQVCRLNHSGTILSKILSSKFLRKWESHHIVLADIQLYSNIPSGFMEYSIAYQDITEAHVMARWDAGQHFCFRVAVPDGSLLFKTSTAYHRDQWLHSLKWKVQLLRYRKLINKINDPESLVKELKELVSYSLSCPIQDEAVFQTPLKIVSTILAQHGSRISLIAQESIILSLSKLLDYTQLSPEICKFFSKHCKDNYHNNAIMDIFAPAVQRILKHNMHCDILRGVLPVTGLDFGKYPHLRMFVQDFLYAKFYQGGEENPSAVKEFVSSIHSPATVCPHPRVLPNMVAVVLAGVYSSFDNSNSSKLEELWVSVCASVDNNTDPKLLNRYTIKNMAIRDRFSKCYTTVLEALAEFDDWRPSLATLLQPIPFPKQTLKDAMFVKCLSVLVNKFIEDNRCEVHQTVLPVREGKDGWIDLFCPGGICCTDDGEFFSKMVGKIMRCCVNKKKFLSKLKRTMLGPFMLLSLRGDKNCIEVLVKMLDVDVFSSEEERLQIISTLQSSSEGKKAYEVLCENKIVVVLQC
ncbi:C-Maf-inducing protein-like isoform X2 [Xenia sp. Carnegie-2017]|uniref:C-Maf-inducing protein-like isoform X2 n=1 Tax=Xenia sp. Carnegie-2017 TaxID=2897299 RepID=UPI001F046B7D|nr:C-Maf-inducing protein-like isoform X2 [Xenia sp. Carnegie-2017]